MKSTFMKLNWNDFLKGFKVAILTPVLPIIQQSIANGELTFNWHLIALAAAGGFVAYLTKNFFTNDVPASVNTITKAGGTVITPDNKFISK